MGKTNKANRTKGNMRPSSSGHSAELLGPTSGFIGFAALGGKEGSFVPVTGDTADISVDSDFRMVMRKMLKRDAVTRLKAVQEFGDYCVQKEKDIVKNVLPFWPRLFNRLVLDLDRRVREATHIANGKLLTKVGREVAPHLRNIMAVWLLGQCDLHAPASCAAKDTFTCTFPQEAKRGEAVLFCRGEVIAHFKDNLFEQTAKTMSEPNPTSHEDMESKYNMVISATLQALKLFLLLTKTTVTDDNNVEQDMKSIISEGKFWKYSKSKEPQIRAAWFSLVSSLCQNCPSVFEGTEKKLATTIFGQLSESDPIVAPSIWESALSIVMNREDCWQVVNINSVTLPQLWILLKGGGKGNASTLFPCLLPLISRLPKETAHSEAFLKQFFSCLGQSLMLDSVKLSTSECDAILSAFFECLQFMCCTRLSDKEGVPLLQEIISTEIIQLLSASLHTEQGTHLAVSRLYPLLSSLLLRAEQKKMSSVVDGFWQQALPVACKAFEECREKTMAFLGYFFHSMVQQTADGRKEKKVVRFKDEENEEACPDVTQPTNKLSNPSNPPEKDSKGVSPVSDRLFNQSNPLGDGSACIPHIVAFCSRLCSEVEDKGCPLGLLRLLEEILTSASSESLLVELASSLSKEGRCKAESLSSFLHEVVLKWLWKVREDERCIGVLLNIVLLSCSFLTAEEAIEVLDGCCKVHVCLIEHVLRKGLESCRSASFLREWLASSRCSAHVVWMFRALVEGRAFFSEVVRPSDVEGCRRTISLCLLDVDTELLVDDTGFQHVLNLLNSLSVHLFAAKFAEKNSQLALNFIRDVSSAVLKNYERCWKFDATEKLVHLLFTTCLKDALLFENSAEVLKTLFGLLDTSVYSYCQAKEQVTIESSLILQMAKELNSFLHSLENQKEASHAKEHCLFLLSSVLRALEQRDSARAMFVCHKLVETILPSPQTWNKLKEGLALNLLPFFLKSKIFYAISLEEKFSYPKLDVLRLTLASEVVSEILCSDILKFVGDAVVVHARQLVWCLAFCRGTRNKLETTEESSSKDLEENFLKLLSLMQTSEIETLKKSIIGLSLNDASWAICVQILGELLPPCELQSLAEEHFRTSSDLDMIEGEQQCMTRQVLIPYLSTEKKQMYFEELLLEMQDTNEEMKYLDDKNFCRKMGEVCCYLQDNKLLLTPPMKNHIGLVFKKLSPYLKVEEEDNTSMMYHLQVENIFSIFCFATNRDFVDSVVWEFFLQKLNMLIDASCRMYMTTPSELLIVHRTLKLFQSMTRFITDTKLVTQETLLLWRPAPLPEKLSRRIILLYLDVSKSLTLFRDKSILNSVACDELLSLVIECVKLVPHEFILHSLFFSVDSDSTLRKTVDLLSSDVRQFQLASHYIMIKVMPHLPICLLAYLADEDSDDDDKKEEYEKIPEKMTPILRGLRFLSDVVDSMLMDVKIGDVCTVVPQTDSYRISLAYLLGWTHLLEFIAASSPQVRHDYATDLTVRGLLPALFFNVFRMMPENPILLLKRQGVGTPKKEDLKGLFLKPPQLDSGYPCSEEVESMACYVFAKALSKVPASIRSWWNNLDRKSADIVNNFTSKYVSAHLCVAEIQAVQEHEKKLENLMVQARPGSREVIATYVVDECPVELCISLPFNHPLGPITAEKRGKGGQAVGEAEWRNWLMQLTTLLTHQNGSIQEGLWVWKKNLDKKFEGVEECTICFMILHSSSLKMPRLSCHVCRKKFHAACLYKWFRTSNNSTCPLCRNEFTT